MKTISGIILLLIANISFGQRDTVFCKSYLSLNMVELIASNFRLSYEYQFAPRQSTSIELGYKIPIIHYSPEYTFEDDLNINRYVYTGVNAIFAYNYFLGRNKFKQNYLSARLNYNYNYCRNIVEVRGTDGNYGYWLTSADKTHYKIDIVFGSRFLRESSGHSLKFIEWYVGGGIRFFDGTKKIFGFSGGYDPGPSAHDIQFDMYPQPSILNYSKLKVDLCIGAKFGIAMKKK